MATERIQGLSIDIGLETLGLQRGLTGLKDQLKTVDSQMKANLSAFDRGEKSIEKYEVTLQGLNDKLGIHKKAMAAAKDEMDDAIKNFGRGSKEAEAATRTYNNQVTAVNNLERRIGGLSRALQDMKADQQQAMSMAGKLESKMKGLGDSLTGIGEKAKSVGSGLSAALTLPLAGAGAGILSLAKNYSDASVQMQNAMGLTDKETAKLTKTAKGLYEKGYGESLDEVTKALAETKTNISSLNKSDLKIVTRNAMLLGKTFDADVNEVTRAGNSLMTNYGMDAKHAFDLMGKGAQNGMNKSKEMFDNISEYTINFKEAGFSAQEMFGILQNGSEKGYNLDRLNDSVLEFKLQTEDSSKSYMAAMSEMDEDTQKVFQKYKDGKASVADVYKAAQKGFAQLKKDGASADQINAIGKGLFGTKWEDQGADIIMSMDTVNKKMKNFNGTMDEIAKNTEKSFSARVSGAIRTTGDAFLPLGNQLLDVAEVILPKVSGAAKTLAGWLESMSPAAKTLTLVFAGIAAAIGPVLAVFGMLVGAIGNIVRVFAPFVANVAKAGGMLNFLKTALMALTGPVGITIGILTALGVGFIALYKKSDTFRSFIDRLVTKIKDLGKSMLNGLKPAISAVKDFLSKQMSTLKKFWDDNSKTILAALSNIGKVVSVIFNGIASVIKFVMPLVLAIIKSVWGNIQGVISGALNVIMGLVKIFSGLFTGDFKKMWEGIKQVFFGAIKLVWNFVQLNMFGKLLGLGKIFVGGFKGLFSAMWTAIKGFFTKGAGAAKDAAVGAWNLLKTVTTTIFNAYKSFLSGIWNFLKSMVTKAAQFIFNGVKTAFNNLKSSTTTVFNAVKGFLSSTWSYLKTYVTKTAQALYNGVKNSFNNLRSSITTIFNAVKSFLSKLWSGLKDMIVKAAQAIFNSVKNSWNNLKNTTTNLFNGIKNFLSKMWTGTKTTVTNLAGKIKDGVVNAWNSLSTKTTSLFTGIKNKVKGIFDDMVDFAKKLPKRISDGIGSMAGKVTGGVKAIGNKMAGQLETVLNAITQKGINVVLDKIGVGDKGKIPKLSIPRYATGTGQGGHKGGLFVAGDGGQNELIRFPDGRTILSPATDTLYHGEKGTEVLNGKQTKQALGYMQGMDVPFYNKGTDWLKNGADVAKGWASKAWDAGKDMTKKVGDSIGDVWSYVSNPSKLMSKVWNTLNLPKVNAGGSLAQIALKGVSKIKDGAVDFVQQKMNEFMPDFGDGGSGIAGYYLGSPFRITTRYTPQGNKADKVHKGGVHRGLDLAAPAGTLVKSLTSGVVREVLKNNPTGGNLARIASGDYLFSYAHMLKAPRVKVGDKVKEGQVIGEVGSTGFSTGNHLDLKIKKNGAYIDPEKYLKNASGGGTGSIGGKGVQRWAPYIRKAAAQMKVGISDYDVQGILAQIKRESTGNDKIVQSPKVKDVNTRNNNPAKGLLQYIPQTFASYRMKGFNDIFNGYHQLLAWFNNTNWKKDNPRGRRGWGPTGKRRYKNGTDFHIGGDAMLGDGGEYEPFLLPNGQLGLSPNVATMFKNLPAGTKVWKDAQTFAKSISSTQAQSQLSQLVALIGKQIQAAREEKNSGIVKKDSQPVKQEINIENKVTIQVAGMLDRETLMKIADQLEEILDDKSRAKLRSEGGFIL